MKKPKTKVTTKKSNGIKPIVIKSLPTNENEWFDEHEAFVTAMKIDTNKTTYEHLQNAFYWFKKRYGGNVL